MATIRYILLILAGSLAGVATSAPAAAQATRTYVSGFGDDSLPCTRLAPCRTFFGAMIRTATGGEIDCIDAAGFGPLTITRSMTIACDVTVGQGGVFALANNAITINIPATSYVTLSGLLINGLGNSASPAMLNGVSIVQGGVVTIRNSTITGFTAGFGINFTPTATAQLMLDDVAVTGNGNAATALTGGLFVKPAAGVTATVRVAGGRFRNNANTALRLDTVGTVGATINATLDGSSLSANTIGVLAKAPSGTGTIRLMVLRSTIDQNLSYGLIASGTGTTIRVGGSGITNNGTGVFPTGFGTLLSYGTNQLDGNTIDGSFSGPPIPNR
ncbi:right-handed parallel beta-helix repeat-containing protein [soil metagenome]